MSVPRERFGELFKGLKTKQEVQRRTEEFQVYLGLPRGYPVPGVLTYVRKARRGI
jgi:hypothetical protein